MCNFHFQNRQLHSFSLLLFRFSSKFSHHCELIHLIFIGPKCKFPASVGCFASHAEYCILSNGFYRFSWRRIFEVMSAATFGQKRFIPSAPDKGSFPLDHENLCKTFFHKYMNCLRTNRDDNSACRIQAKDYLQCRMDNNLMAKEEWSKLGFKNDQIEQAPSPKQ